MKNLEQGYKTIKDLVKILSLFITVQGEEKSVTEISKVVGMHPSKVSRMLRSLESAGFFEKSLESGKFRLGIPFFELGISYVSNLPLRKIIRPHVEQIAKECNLTSSWAILKDSKVIVIDRVQNFNPDLLTHTIGLNVPFHCTSTGKVLLAYLSEEEQDRILESTNLLKFTDRTIVDRNLIRENLKLIREKGYATDEEETHKDVNCMAAPIRNDAGVVIAAINMMDYKLRTCPEDFFKLADYLMEKALFISRQLGYRRAGF